MKTRTITGVILAESEKAYLVDIGQKTKCTAWIAKKAIQRRWQDKLYPVITVFEVWAGLPIRPRLEKIDENRFTNF